MSALLDTSVLVPGLPPEGFGIGMISVVTVGELEAGVLVAATVTERAERLRRLGELVVDTTVLAVDRTVASRYGELRAVTGRRPANDLWIAATALAHDLTLVTADKQQAKLPLVRTSLVG